jgi:two-component system, chemotaxis family, response regulator Rcp1
MKTVQVLLVEDNLADIELVREALSAIELRYVLHIATDYEQARDYVQSISAETICPDILLMDLNLPKGSGLELLRLFRARPDCQHTPVIVVSSSNAVRDRERAAQLGAMHYFRKPTDFQEFMKLGPLIVESLDHQAGA